MRETSTRRCSVKKGFLRNFSKFTGKHLCQSLFFNKAVDLSQVLSCEFYEISMNRFFYGKPQVAVSVMLIPKFHNKIVACHHTCLVFLTSFFYDYMIYTLSFCDCFYFSTTRFPLFSL